MGLVLSSDKPSTATRTWWKLRRVWRRVHAGLELRLQQKRWRINVSLAAALGIMIAAPSFTHPLIAGIGNCWRVCSVGGWVASIWWLVFTVAIYALAFLSVAWIARQVVWSRLEVVHPSDCRCRVLIMGLSEELVPLGAPGRLKQITEIFEKHGWDTSPAYPGL